MPAWMSATRVPPPRSADQSTASFSAIDAHGPLPAFAKSRWNAEAVGSDWPW